MEKIALMKRSLFLLIAAACLGGTQMAQSAVVVTWGGDLVSATVDFTGRGGTYPAGSNTGYWNYTGTATRNEPQTGYTGTPFTWGAYLTRSETGTASQKNFSALEVREGAADAMVFVRNNSSGVSGPWYSGAGFVAFAKADFANDYDTETLGYEQLTSLSVTTSYQVLTGYRFAILNDGVWYLSEASVAPTPANTAGSYTLTGSELTDGQWAVWSPTGGENGRLGDTPMAFDVDGSTFEDIQGFGLYMDINPARVNGSSVGVQITRFEVTAIPEPGVMALAIVSAGLFWSRRRSLW